ncbi:hypothetical protein ACI4AF_28935, partial [Klebsiella pneumoniae]|uniref:hypothetical protein n=1 Tax=Klebsiella pneumoniae TaxID=573 RepID=UPI0038551891
MKSNELKGIPADFEKLTSLQDLNIAMNLNSDYKVIIPVLAKMKSLRRLDISYNNITKEDAKPLKDALPSCVIINSDYSTKLK